MPQVAASVMMKGKPLALIGTIPQVGQAAPDFTLVANDLSEAKLGNYKGKKLIISVVPSLDTPICDLQTKRFNKEAEKLNDVVILTVSRDLPFAQKRWCGATNSTKVVTLSDFKSGAFGRAYGVLVQGLEILARAVFIVDAKGKISYVQLVPEVTTEPNYEEVLQAVKKA
ncbi:MAG: lipid hydroperoxide peroxidase [Omnitrophica WOR_2 bacterium GWA2_47_8]|nr:MAG: lipid hydroperoxide peroxidase [Omnitrophica WOR_2 bacterium GWA2_47_8]